MSEGRQPSPDFDASCYVRPNKNWICARRLSMPHRTESLRRMPRLGGMQSGAGTQAFGEQGNVEMHPSEGLGRALRDRAPARRHVLPRHPELPAATEPEESPWASHADSDRGDRGPGADRPRGRLA